MGGHSGAEIDKKRANANVLMGRFLYSLQQETAYEIISLAGGQKDNAITREADAELLVEDINSVKAVSYTHLAGKTDRKILDFRRYNPAISGL